MWKIIKSNLEQISIKKEKFLLWMKWQFKIEFANDNFWPYDYKFAREDCYYNDWLEDRWSYMFPLKNKEFDNTEIFLENDDIIICTWERSWLLSDSKNFIDVINLKTEKKQRFFTDEVNLIYNWEKDIIINLNISWVYKTMILNIETLEIIEEKEEYLLWFFKCIYSETERKWFLLDFIRNGWNNDWFFELKELTEISYSPKSFDRYEFKVNKNIDIWELSCK